MTSQNVLGFLVLGLSIGWLMGLSMSPVAGGVLAAIVAAAGSIVAAFAPSSVEGAPKEQNVHSKIPTSPWSLTLLVLGVAVAAPIGVKVREAGVLGPPGGSRQTSKDSTTTLPVKLVLSVDSSSQRATGTRVTGAAGLKSVIAPDDCALLLASAKESLAQAFQNTGDETLRVIGRRVANREELGIIRSDLCPTKQ